MIKSTITELTKADVQANFETYTLTDFYYPSIFPLKSVATPSWKAVEGIAGAPVAADIVSMDSTAPRKMRPRVQGNQGDIPKMSIAREKMESELMDYYLLRQLAQSSGDYNALFEWIYEDDQFCFTGIAAKIEFLALKAASLGKVALDNSNNDGNVVTEYVVDFLIPAGNKRGVAVPFTTANAATSKPLTVFKDLIKEAKGKGVRLRYAFMDEATLDGILASEEVLKKTASFILQATNLAQTPTRAQLQAYLTANLGITIGIIDSYVTIEVDSVQTTVSPWEAGVIMFSETPTLGNTYHSPLAEEHASFDSKAIKVKRGNVLLKKYAVEEPFKEVTIAMSNSFPVISNAKAKYLIDTLATTWTK